MIRNQLPRLGRDHQPLALAGLETIAVHFAGSDLAVGRAGQRDAVLDLVFRPLAQGELLLAEHLELAGAHRLPADFGQLADVEHQRVRHAARRCQPDLPPAGLGVGRDGDLDHDQVGDRGAGRRWTYSAIRLLDLAISFAWPRPCPPGPGGCRRHHRLPERIIARRPSLGGHVPLRLCFNSLSCSSSKLHFLGVQSAVVLDHLGGNARAGDQPSSTSSRPCPPNRIWNVVPCWPPAG